MQCRELIPVATKNIINPLYAPGLFQYPLKTSENFWLPDVFRGYWKGTSGTKRVKVNCRDTRDTCEINLKLVIISQLLVK